MRARILVVLALVLVAALAAGCGTAVPDVKGKTAEQATAALVAAGFKLGRVDYVALGEGANGAVIGQDPQAGQRVTAGSVVNISVAGRPYVLVPSLVGLTREGVAAALNGAGLAAGSVGETMHPTAAVGTVVIQAPAAGTTITAGDKVDIWLSIGPKPPVTGTDLPDAKPNNPPAPVKVKVPTVKGLTLANAQAKLAAVGLKYKNVLGPGDGMTDVGFAYKSVPAAGTLVAKGTTVIVYSWKGP